MNVRAMSLLGGVVFCAIILAFGVTQEVPVGSAKGRLIMKENGHPLVNAYVTFTPPDESSTEGIRSRTVQTDKEGGFRLSNLPAGLYRVSASAKEHKLDEQVVTINEGISTTLELQLDPGDLYLKLYASQRVFTPEEKPEVEMHGFVPDDSVDVEVYRLDVAKVAKRGELRETISPLAHPEYGEKLDLKQVAEKQSTQPQTITKKDAEGAFIQPLEIPKLGEGFYWVRCTASGKMAGTFVNVTRIALVTKTYERKGLCYVTDVSTGKPIEGADIQVQKGDKLSSAGKTGKDGLLDVTFAGDSKATVVAKMGASTALCGFYMGSGGGEGDEEDASGGPTRIFTYTDRPIYRPGDTVRFKGIARKLVNNEYKLPGKGSANIEIYDGDENLIQKMTVPVTAHGTFSGSFATNSEAAPGGFKIKSMAFGGVDNYFAAIAAYRKPDYSIEVKPTKPYFVLGEKATFTVECKYYFGGPVVGAKVTGSVYRSTHWTDYYGDEGDDVGDNSFDEGFRGGEYSKEIEATTDANGKAIIEVDTKADNDPDTFASDFDYTANVSVADAGDKYFSGEGKVLVARGDFDMQVETTPYIVGPNQSVDVTVTTRSHDDHPKPVGNRTVTVETGTETWSGHESKFTASGSYTVTTGADGIGHVLINPGQKGSLSIRAKAKDDGGHQVEADGYVYVEGSSMRRGPKEGKLTLTLDKKKYNIGDRMKALIQTDSSGGTALVCIQADKIISRQLVEITGPSVTIEMPVTKEQTPNAFVSVAYIHNKQFLEANKKLIVDLGERKLNISITPDRPAVKPGETVNLKVRTTDQQGKPVSAEVSVGVVDESIYALKKDATNPLAGLYPKRNDGVTTSYSFPEIYLDGGDKGGANIPVRTKFLDTAEWLPTVQTGPTGETTVPVTLPDNITMWRATALGVTDDTAVGISTGTFKARKELMVRMSVPTFLVQQDEQRISATITNDTGQDADVNVQLQADNAGINGEPSQKIRVRAGAPVPLDWTLKANASGNAVFTVKAWIDGGASDAERRTVMVQPHGRVIEDQNSGQASPSSEITMTLRESSDRKAGRLNLTITPTIGTALYQSLDDLVQFPYGCVEQTMSRFLPAVLVAKQVNLTSRADLAKRIPLIAADGYARLKKMRHRDGAWGWWEYDNSDPYMTAYVLDGLLLAKDAGYPNSGINPDTALKWAEGRLEGKDEKQSWRNPDDLLGDRVYLAYSLARYGRKDQVGPFLRKIDLKTANATTIALVALTANAMGSEFYSMRDEAMGRLEETRQGSSISAHWGHSDYWYGEEVNAWPLRAFMEIRPTDPLVPGIIRYLMLNRRGNMWESTRDSAQVLVGITKYLAMTKEGSESATITVSLNGRPVRTLTFDPASITNPDTQITVPIESLQPGANKILVNTTGKTPVYYSADLKQYDVQSQIGQLVTSTGIEIHRKYFVMEARAMEDGKMKLMPSEKPVDQAKSGDIIRCELTLKTDKSRDYLLIEDPIPSNCRITERDDTDDGESWGWWWSKTVIRDDRIAFFSRHVDAGSKVITYNMRAEGLGVGHALPTNVTNMYDPAQKASSGENILTVVR